MPKMKPKTRKPKVPSNGSRRAGSVHSPRRIEDFLVAGLVRLAKRWNAQARAILLSAIPTFAKPARKEDRRDAKRPSTKGVEQQLRSAASRTFSEQAVRSSTESAARRVESYSKDAFRRLGIKPEKEPILKHLVNGWSRDQAERVKGLADEQITRLAKILDGAGNREAQNVAKDIEEQLEVSESRAAFIARDSIQTLNSQIANERARAAKILFYVWTSMRDARVRDTHAELDGEVFDVDGPGDPDEGHPGEPPNCRCVAFYLPDTETEEEEG